MTTDFLSIQALFTDEQRLIQNTISQFVDKEIKPVINHYAQEAKFPAHLIPQFGELGVFGSFIPQKYGCTGLDYISYGIIAQEMEKGDSAIRSTISVQSSLVMNPIYLFGSEEQKIHYLPKLASGEMIGCFGLTEPNHGSNPSAMETRFKETPEGYILNGAKMWITNSPISAIAVVWAKNEEGRIKGLLVDLKSKGVSAPEIKNKWSLRASITGELVFDNVLVPKENLLPLADGLAAPLKCLDSARYGIGWGAIGAAIDCYETALKYSKERIQFDKPLAAFQLTQKKLSEMLTEITKAQLLALRVGQLMNEGNASSTQISMLKRNNVNMALEVARESRQILGAIGIVGDYPIMRHMMNLESVITYEGTHDIHHLILGAEITGIQAFK